MKSTVSEKGQITIPKALRERLGLRAGDSLEFEEERGRLVARKIAPRDRVDAVYGILGQGRRTNELIEEMRGPGLRRRKVITAVDSTVLDGRPGTTKTRQANNT